MGHALFTSALLSVAAGGLAATIAKTLLFMRLREWCQARGYYLGYLVSCPYCVAHWTVFVAAAVYRPRLVNSGVLPLDLVATAFAMITVATFVAGLLVRLYWR